MKLETYILKSIWQYPSLYYQSDFEKSKTAVLNQAFLVGGSGIEFNPKDGDFRTAYRPNRTALPKGAGPRLKAGEPLIAIGPAEIKIGKVFHDMSGMKYIEDIMFVKDFKKTGEKIYKWAQETKHKTPKHRIGQIFPRETEDYVKFVERNPIVRENWNKWGWLHPYPFFNDELLNIYDNTKKSYINKNLIKPDWREGLLFIFNKALAWYQDDSCWNNDDYYNWAGSDKWDRDNYFKEKWESAKSVEALCKDYAIPYQPFKTAKEMAVALCALRRVEYIDRCKKIIAHFS